MIAVTGANGFIGSNLVRELLSRGKQVRALVRTDCEYPALKGLKIEFHQTNLNDIASLSRAFAGVEYVYHVAGMVSLMPGKWNKLYQVNVEGTQNVIEACLKAGVKRLIYTSSVHAIPEGIYGVPILESLGHDPKGMVGNYAKTKALATSAALQASQAELEVVAVCPTGVMGPFDFQPSRTGKMLIDVARQNLPAITDGAFDFVDVRDVAIGHILAAERGVPGEAYLLPGERLTVRELTDLAAAWAKVKSPGRNVPKWLALAAAYAALPYYWLVPGSTPILTPYTIYTLGSNSFISGKKAEEELGFKARPIRETIQDSLNWMKMMGKL